MMFCCHSVGLPHPPPITLSEEERCPLGAVRDLLMRSRESGSQVLDQMSEIASLQEPWVGPGTCPSPLLWTYSHVQ